GMTRSIFEGCESRAATAIVTRLTFTRRRGTLMTTIMRPAATPTQACADDCPGDGEGPDRLPLCRGQAAKPKTAPRQVAPPSHHALVRRRARVRWAASDASACANVRRREARSPFRRD